MWALDDSDSPSASSSSSALAEWGVWVRDGAVAEESADELRAEILGCFEAGRAVWGYLAAGCVKGGTPEVADFVLGVR